MSSSHSKDLSFRDIRKSTSLSYSYSAFTHSILFFSKRKGVVPLSNNKVLNNILNSYFTVDSNTIMNDTAIIINNKP